ncbi:MAG: hypothetical protein HJJLKODD_01074 [Phycisphaerae bacterium]|nr:hypothetical protein [Phycisphaerae bacterium]
MADILSACISWSIRVNNLTEWNPRAEDTVSIVPQTSASEAIKSRRQLLAGGILASLVGSGAAQARAEEADRDITRANWFNSLQLAYQRLQRMTLAVTPEELLRYKQLGQTEYLEYQLDYQAIVENPDLLDRLTDYPALDLPPALFINLDYSTKYNSFYSATFLRQIYSTRQLFERMVIFWTDHFNTSINASWGVELKPYYDRDCIRQHALGYFPELLRATAYSPCMLAYLNNDTSYKTHPNQNYARELMELHTLGVDGGYTQDDVEEVARCFTGWSWYYPWEDDELAGTFYYRPTWHDNNQKVVLGHVIPAGGGIQDGEMVLDILAHHPSTIQFVSYKMCRWLMGYNPTEAEVNQVVQVYQNTDGHIPSMIRKIFELLQPMPTGFIPAEKLKRPYELALSIMRGLNVTVGNPMTLKSQGLDPLGQVPYNWNPPNGYPDSLDFWGHALLSRWNFAFALLSGQIGTVSANLSFCTGCLNAEELIGKIDRQFFAASMPTAQRQVLKNFITSQGSKYLTNPQEAVAMALACPAFQMY